ncbi:hypothetical protein SKAU_G00161300 [Synaphobranchus kaupii]|uniref:PDZ domain-containing protein n=1 Tax=Synaphobranchus kaupii TaxID=118154 RepID=A0A9Q1FIK3_SYNKA|nr:hypothetical protein SKAU_G00161300 [Synaphobranchus kaupii]
MNGRTRTRSFSENLVLDDSEKGGVVITDIKNVSFADRSGLKEGDEIVGATIHFDNLKKDDVVNLLKLIEPFDNQMQVLTREDLKTSLSLSSLNTHSKVPEDMLKDSYNKLYKRKVKKFLKPDSSLSGTDEDLTVELKSPSGKLNAAGPELNLEGPNLKGTTLNGEVPSVNAKTPDLRMPKFGLQGSNPDVRLPDVTLNQPAIDTNLSLPRSSFAGPFALRSKGGT